MLFYIDLDLLEVITTATDTSRVVQREIQRGDNTPVEVRFVRKGIQESLPAGTVLTFCAKADMKFDGPPIILQSAFVLTGAGVTAAYVASVAADTAPLNTLLAVDGIDTNDLPLIDLMGEFSWQLLPAKPVSTRRFRTRVNNDIYKGDETFPATLPGPDDFVSARAVLYDRAQTLTAAQQSQARSNAGVGNAIAAALNRDNLVPQTSFINPTTLATGDFTRVVKHRPMSPMDESAIYFDEKFTTGNSGQWVGGLETAPGFTIAGKYSTAVNGQIYQYAEARPVIPYTSASIRIEEMGTTNATIWAVGFQAGSNPANGQGRVFATYNRASGITDILVRKADGTVSAPINPVTIPWTGPFELCLMLAGEGVSVWTRKTDNDAWVFATTVEIPTLFDARELANLAALRPCFYSSKDTGVEAMTISRFRAGYVMGVGIANPSLVTYENGEPYIKEDRVYFLANATMPSHALNSGTQIRASSACIWSLGLSDMSFRCDSRLNFARLGKSYGDNSGCIVFDRKTQEFILMVPNWGDLTTAFDMKVFLFKTKTNILTGVHLLTGTQLSLPGYSIHQWDPSLRKDGDVWKLVYNTFDGANPRDIRTATSTDLTTWTAVNTYVSNCEGSKWLRFGGVWYIVAAVAESSHYLVFNQSLALVATITTPTDAVRHSLGCHPQFVHVPKADKSQLMLITMDNFWFRDRGYSWGNLDVYKVGAETNGWEWKHPAVLQ